MLYVFFFLLIVIGALLLRLFFKQEKFSFLKSLALSYFLGWAVVTGQVFIFLFYLKLTMANWWLWWFGLEVVVLAVCLFFKDKWVIDEIKAWPTQGLDFLKRILKFPKVELLLSCLVLIFIALTLVNALNQPLTGWDSVANWSFKAKSIFEHQKIIFDPNQAYFWKDFSYPNYPWQLSVGWAYLGFLIGNFSDMANNLVSFGFYLGAVILLYDFLLKYTSRRLSLLFAWFLASSSLFMYHGYAQYGDLPLGALALAGFICLFETYRQVDYKKYLLAGIFMGIATLSKNEAIFFVLASLPWLWLSLKRFDKKLKQKNILFYFIGLASTSLFWWLFKLINNLGVRNTESGFYWHPEIIPKIFDAWFSFSSFNLFWFGFFLILIMNFKAIKQDRHLFFGYLYLLLILGQFIFVYIFTQSYTYALDGTVVSRNILSFLPIAMILTALSLKGESALLNSDNQHV